MASFSIAPSLFFLFSVSCCSFLLAPTFVGATLDPLSIPKYENLLFIPPAMLQTPTSLTSADYDYYEIGLKQFEQQLLPPSMGLPKTTIWGYGSLTSPQTCDLGGSFCSPSPTFETIQSRAVRIKWVNQLVDEQNNYLPHLLPVDQTLHWANPVGPVSDMAGTSQALYNGPVPMIPHVHGAHTTEDSDGYPEAWFLPKAANIDSYIPTGAMYEYFKNRSVSSHDWENGSAVFNYANTQRPASLWIHDHSLGLTRVNVYAGPVMFYIIRGDEGQINGTLPGPAPQINDPVNTEYYEIPLVIQDRMFNKDGSLFYPDYRGFYESLNDSTLLIPFSPDMACASQPSDVHPIWQPEFYGDTILVNGRVWPRLEVAPIRYRFRLLNACNARVLILKFSPDLNLNFTILGNDGGFLPQPESVNTLIMGAAERLDLEIDFSQYSGQLLILLNVGPDGGYGDGAFDPANPQTTGQVIRFDVVKPVMDDPSTPPQDLKLPSITPIKYEGASLRQVGLTDFDSLTVKTDSYSNGTIFLDCNSPLTFEMVHSYLGTYLGDPGVEGKSTPLSWSAPVTETPTKDETEIWDVINLTEDAHPIHIHQVQFQVLYREPFGQPEARRPPLAWETGFKDTVITYPDETLRLVLKFDIAGTFVWHCHLLEHEDNEMMRPILVKS